jgi:hypothetical protein
LVILAFLLLDLRDITSFQKHPGIVDRNGISKSDVNDDANLFVWLKSNLTTLLLGLKDDAGHVDVESLLVEVTCYLDFYFLWDLIV